MADAPVATLPVKAVAGIIRIFIMIFVLVGFGLFSVGMMTVMEARSAAHWPSVSGEIVTSVLETRSSDGRKTQQAVIGYRYTVADKEYIGSRIYFGHDVGIGRPDAGTLVRQYAVGTEVRVFYDPTDPSNSVLEPAPDAALFVMRAIGFVFFIVGVLGLRRVKALEAVLEKGAPGKTSGPDELPGERQADSGRARRPREIREEGGAPEWMPSSGSTGFPDVGKRKGGEGSEAHPSYHGSLNVPEPLEGTGPGFGKSVRFILWLVLAALLVLYVIQKGWF